MTCIHYRETLTALRGVRLSTKSCAMGIPSSNLPEHCEHCSMRTEDAYVQCPICDRTFPSGVDMSYDGDWAMCKDCAKRLKGERMTELKPCWFCGCTMSLAIRDYPIVKIRHYSIVHPDNGCILQDFKSPEISARQELVDMWNRRATVSEMEYVGDAELLTWVNTWLDSARFDTDLTEEEQDACWIVLSAVARLQREGERMTDFNYVRCDFCKKEIRREGHYRILEGWLRVDAQSRDASGTLCAHPCQIDACPNCVRKHPVLKGIYERTRDERADMMVTVRRESE